MRAGAFFILIFTLVTVTYANAFSPDELVNLKKAGLGEKLIIQLVRMGYTDTSTLLKLKEAGFSDDAIFNVVEVGMKSEDNGKASPLSQKPQAAGLTAEAKAKITWYLIYRGKPVVRNSKEIDKAVVSLTGRSLSVAWQPPQGVKAFVSALNVEPFASPFLWDIAPSDTVAVREGGHQILLRSSPSKLGHPRSDDNSYYEICLSTGDPALVESFKAFR